MERKMADGVQLSASDLGYRRMIGRWRRIGQLPLAGLVGRPDDTQRLDDFDGAEQSTQ